MMVMATVGMAGFQIRFQFRQGALGIRGIPGINSGD